jgi:protein-tyrosine-phosphatase
MDAEAFSTEDRARVLAALGDPARLAIVDALALGDASPGELGRSLGLPTNLIAHHLNVLQGVRLIGRGPSEGDRRRTYIRLVPATLAALGLPAPVPVRRVVFVCTHNSARSQFAAALWADRSSVPAASAGTRPATRVHPRTVRVAKRHGLSILATATADLVDVLQPADFLVAVCDNAHEHLLDQHRTGLHWSVPDPARVDTDAAFEAAYADIADRIDRLVPRLVEGEPA